MTTIDILKRARALVERGWCQNALVELEDGSQLRFTDSLYESMPSTGDVCRVCAEGGVEVAWVEAGNSGEIPFDHPAFQALVKAVRDLDEDCSVHAWNDAPGRTQSEVLAAFDRAIASLESTK